MTEVRERVEAVIGGVTYDSSGRKEEEVFCSPAIVQFGSVVYPFFDWWVGWWLILLDSVRGQLA